MLIILTYSIYTLKDPYIFELEKTFVNKRRNELLDSLRPVLLGGWDKIGTILIVN